MFSFSKLIHTKRTALSLSPKDLATRCNLDPSLISRYENGNRQATRAHVVLLAKALLADEEEFLITWWQSKIMESLKEENMVLVKKVLTGLNPPDETIKPALHQPGETLARHLQEFARLNKLWQGRKERYKDQNTTLDKTDELRFICHSCALSGNGIDPEQALDVLEHGTTIGGKTFAEHLQLLNHREAWLMLKKKINSQEPLNERFLKQLREKIRVKDQDLPAGKMRKTELEQLNSLRESKDVPATAARIYIYFMDIPDLGLFARSMVNFYLVKNGFPPVIFSSQGKTAQRYKNALELYLQKNETEELVSILISGINTAVKERISMLES